MRSRFCFFLMLGMLLAVKATAQQKYDVEHFGIEDGLPQKAVMDILQDDKGFIWLSNWDGIARFDGSAFHSYTLNKQNRRLMRNQMYLDKLGYIWIKSHESEIYRFDPRQEKFDDLKSAVKATNFPLRPRKVLTMPSGKTWLFEAIKGCICFKDSAFRPMFINSANHLLLNDAINTIYEDQQRNSWILTANGVYLFSPDMQSKGAYFTSGTPFYSAAELGNEIWFGTDNGNVVIYDKATKKFRPFATGTSADIRIVKNIDKNRLLLCSSSSPFFVYNRQSHVLAPFDMAALSGGQYKNLSSAFIDHQFNIWMQAGAGDVVKFDPQQQKLYTYPGAKAKNHIRPDESPFAVWQDINNRIWVNSAQAGFASYDPLADKLVPMAGLVSPGTNYFSSLLYAGFSDKQGNLWSSTKVQGIEKITFSDAAYKFDHLDPDSNHNVRSIMEDNTHRLWVATKDRKINIYTADLKRVGWLTEDGSIGTGKPLGAMAYSMVQDAEANIWIGTKGQGIFKLVPDGAGKRYKVMHFLHNEADPYSVSDNKVYRIFADSRNRIWIGTYSGGLNLADQSAPGRFYNYKNQFKNYPIQQSYHVRTINEDHQGKLYLGTTQGLLVLPANIAAGSFTGYKYYDQGTELKSNSWGANDVYDICVTQSGDIYIATFGGGVNKVVEKDASGFPKRFFNYSTKNGLISNLVLQIKEDMQHQLWVVSESSLMRFNPKNQQFENYDDVSKQIKEEIFSEGGDINTSSGTLMLGTTGGFVAVNTAQINPGNFKPYVALTGLQIANREAPIGPGLPLSQNIDDLSSLKLGHKQSFISLEFAALDYTTAGQIKYAYKLDGVDSGWVQIKEQSAKYINLSPGNYLFHVKSTNTRGLWLANEHTLAVEIVPAFWQTKWAWAFYVLAGLALIFFVSRSIVIFFRLTDRLALEHEQTEMKSAFFTDISHEIRTPLTMIVTPVEDILELEQINDNVSQQLQLVLKNAKRMMRLVNQILDFRKIQHQQLTVQETSIGPFVVSIANDFLKTANTAGVRLTIHDETNGEKIFVDRESIDKMMYNLLSNAFKHTPKGGCIKVNIFAKDEKTAVQVSDTGTGMPAETIQKLFKRFMSFHTDKSKPSTGIGLSIVKEIIERHGAEITVESTENEGSVFTAYFIKGAAHFRNAENVTIAHSDIPEPEDKIILEKPVTERTGAAALNSILLVEDDDDLRKYIAGLLIDKYRLFEATDGQQALAIALREVPDFIISDIMMPRMDGIELLSKIREQPTISHIPMIMLTAKIDRDTEISAYDLGADAYITKPFSAKMLQARIKTILEQRKKLYLHLKEEDGHEQPADQNQQPANHGQNQQFIATVRQEIEKNITNHSFTVDSLIATMPMSRSVFVKKLRSLTGLSPIEYMRAIKFQHAAKLIDTNQYSIKEISYMIGINDTKYFSTRFKEIMGVLPSEYRKEGSHKTQTVSK